MQNPGTSESFDSKLGPIHPDAKRVSFDSHHHTEAELPNGAIAGIIIAVVLIVCALLAITIYFALRNNQVSTTSLQ